jgi:hypothetical protein
MKLRSRNAGRDLDHARRTRALLSSRDIVVILVANPSLILAALYVVLRRVQSYRLIDNAHIGAVTPYINRQGCISRPSPWLTRCSDPSIGTDADCLTGHTLHRQYIRPAERTEDQRTCVDQRFEAMRPASLPAHSRELPLVVTQ